MSKSWIERAREAGVDTEQVTADMDTWHEMAAAEGLVPGTAWFIDRLGQLIHLEIQSLRRGLMRACERVERERKRADKAERERDELQRAVARGGRRFSRSEAKRAAYEQIVAYRHGGIRGPRATCVAIDEMVADDPYEPRPSREEIGRAFTRRASEPHQIREAPGTAITTVPEKAPRVVVQGDYLEDWE